MPHNTRRRLVKALGGIATLGLLAGCADTGDEDDGMEGDDGMEEE